MAWLHHLVLGTMFGKVCGWHQAAGTQLGGGQVSLIGYLGGVLQATANECPVFMPEHCHVVGIAESRLGEEPSTRPSQWPQRRETVANRMRALPAVHHDYR